MNPFKDDIVTHFFIFSLKIDFSSSITQGALKSSHPPIIIQGMLFMFIGHYILLSSMVLALSWNVLIQHHTPKLCNNFGCRPAARKMNGKMMLGICVLCLALVEDRTVANIMLMLLLTAAPACGAIEVLRFLVPSESSPEGKILSVHAHVDDNEEQRMLQRSCIVVWKLCIMGSISVLVVGHCYVPAHSPLPVLTAMMQLATGITWLLSARASYVSCSSCGASFCSPPVHGGAWAAVMSR